MALSNSDKIGKALDLLREGLQPFVEREMKRAHGEGWQLAVADMATDDKVVARALKQGGGLDVHALLSLVWNCWRNVFNVVLGETDRTYVKEARDVRNRWAHQEAFTSRDALRAHDTIARLLEAISAPQAAEVLAQSEEIQNLVQQERLRGGQKKEAAALLAGRPTEGLKPWRELVTPHSDVSEGTFQRAEFAADLWQVHVGSATTEYGDPVEFFRRTYLTAGLKELLVGAVKRLGGAGGDPVIELQTSFGGGKTHSMLALYHLFGAKRPTELSGCDEVIAAAGAKPPPSVKRVVLVGTKISPGQESKKPDGTVVRTLWGEIAWQLGGKEAYARVKKADETSTSPGHELTELFNKYGPCIILIDEWVAYARQLHDRQDLCGGTFDTHFTFAQTLTECAKDAKQTLLVVSIPESVLGNAKHEAEVGGVMGKEAVRRLKSALGRVETSWRPANAEESFEIVRRRLFDPIVDNRLALERDKVCAAFSDLYVQNRKDFPKDCAEKDYERRMKAAYPIHPELFARLYDDWASLDRFQRTRGVLRLMAAVIHTLWRRDDRNLMILPSMVPVDEESVASELTRYLDDGWRSVLDKDVDGAHSLPVQIDGENKNLGRVSAARRAARAIFLGSAPTVGAANRGLEDTHIKLGCVQPGETPAITGDALRYLTDKATFLYVDGRRYWYATQPSVTRLAEDRAQQQKEDDVHEEIRRRLREAGKSRGEFHRVHATPPTSAEVPDEPDCALVILGPEAPHAKAKADQSLARREAAAILDGRGSAPRIFKNAVVFLAADAQRIDDVAQSVRQYLAWKSIDESQKELNLDEHQRKQAATKHKNADKTVDLRILEAWTVALYPEQPDPRGATSWQEARIPGGGDDVSVLPARTAKKLKQDGALASDFGASVLKAALDKAGIWHGDHVALKDLATWFSSYVYLQRLTSQRALATAVSMGLSNPMTPEFAYAEGLDAKKGGYVGLTLQRTGAVDLDGSGLIVKRDVAERLIEEERRRREAERAAAGYPTPTDGSSVTGPAPGGTKTDQALPPTKPPPKLTHYHGTYVFNDPTKLSTDVGKIAQEIVQHLNALPDAEVRLTLEISATVPSGVPDKVVRIVAENGKTLKVTGGFE
jgi:predicted AAA+ superfamily ATPase